MKEQLTKYIDLLFAGAPNESDIKQEILQNTLDRYDDLIAQGKTPQAAYQLAISGIGDINEILGSTPDEVPPIKDSPASTTTPIWKKVIRALAICCYIISPIPLFVLSELGMETIGLCGTLAIVAVATALIVLAGGKSAKTTVSVEVKESESELGKAISFALGVLSVCVYLAISFTTHAWWITWLVFPIMGAVKGLVKACMDLKEACKHEK